MLLMCEHSAWPSQMHAILDVEASGLSKYEPYGILAGLTTSTKHLGRPCSSPRVSYVILSGVSTFSRSVARPVVRGSIASYLSVLSQVCVHILYILYSTYIQNIQAILARFCLQGSKARWRAGRAPTAFLQVVCKDMRLRLRAASTISQLLSRGDCGGV